MVRNSDILAVIKNEAFDSRQFVVFHIRSQQTFRTQEREHEGKVHPENNVILAKI